MLAQQFINALSLGCVYALFALGFTLIFGVLGVINLSHGAVFMAGAYAAFAAITRLDLPLWAAAVAAMAAAGCAGALIDVLILKPLRKRNAPHLIPMIATIGVAIILNNGAQALFGADNLRFPAQTLPEQAMVIAGMHVTVIDIGIIVMSVALMAALVLVMRRTQFGRALRAIAESPKAAWLLGINVERLFLVTSTAAAALGGLTGLMIGLYANALYPLMGQPMLLKGVAVFILGCLGQMAGAVLRGMLVGFAEVFSVAYIGSTMRDAVAFGLLFLVLLLRPQGLFGKSVQRKA
jgi:branched-chain amino acid transport system permease protein